jgi:hypothetical protein
LTFDLDFFTLHHKTADLAAFRRHIGELTPGRPVVYARGAQRLGADPAVVTCAATSLLLLAALLELVTFLVFSQALARFVWVESSDRETLSALRMTESQGVALAAARGVFLGTVAAVVATAVAVAASSAMPFGRPRMAGCLRDDRVPHARSEDARHLAGAEIVAISLAIGIPVGVACGRLPVGAVRPRHGVGGRGDYRDSAPRRVVIGAIAFALVIGSTVGGAARRTPVARVLRAEWTPPIGGRVGHVLLAQVCAPDAANALRSLKTTADGSDPPPASVRLAARVDLELTARHAVGRVRSAVRLEFVRSW